MRYCVIMGEDRKPYGHETTAETSLLISMGESNTVVIANTLYRHLQYYCFYPSI